MSEIVENLGGTRLTKVTLPVCLWRNAIKEGKDYAHGQHRYLTQTPPKIDTEISYMAAPCDADSRKLSPPIIHSRLRHDVRWVMGQPCAGYRFFLSQCSYKPLEETSRVNSLQLLWREASMLASKMLLPYRCVIVITVAVCLLPSLGLAIRIPSRLYHPGPGHRCREQTQCAQHGYHDNTISLNAMHLSHHQGQPLKSPT